MIFSFRNMLRVAFLLTPIFILISCKEKQITIDDIKAKYITEIKKDVIFFEDGLSYNMEVNDSSYVYFLTRHAEKDTISKTDPRLTEIGYNRAAKLYRLLKGTRLDAVYSTLYMRTLETVDSIANAKGMPILPYTPQNFKEIHRNIKDSTEFTRILISGHSNTTPVLSNYLSNTNYFTNAFDEDDYDNFVVIIDRGNDNIDLIPLRYKP